MLAQSSCIFSFHVGSPANIVDAIGFFIGDTYFQSWVCSSYYFDNAPVADAVGTQRKNTSLLWNKSVHGQAERSRYRNALTASAQATWRLCLAADCRDFSAVLQSSEYLARTTFFQAEVVPDTFI